MDMVGPDWVWIGSQIWVESPMDPVVPDGVIGCLGYTNVSNPIYKRFYNKWQDLYTSQPNTLTISVGNCKQALTFVCTERGTTRCQSRCLV